MTSNLTFIEKSFGNNTKNIYKRGPLLYSRETRMKTGQDRLSFTTCYKWNPHNALQGALQGHECGSRQVSGGDS